MRQQGALSLHARAVQDPPDGLSRHAARCTHVSAVVPSVPGPHGARSKSAWFSWTSGALHGGEILPTVTAALAIMRASLSRLCHSPEHHLRSMRGISLPKASLGLRAYLSKFSPPWSCAALAQRDASTPLAEPPASWRFPRPLALIAIAKCCR